MKQAKKVRKVTQVFLSMAMAVLLAGIASFSSVAAETNVLTDGIEEEGEIEVLYATLIEDDIPSFEVSPYTMLADCIIGVSCASDGMHIDISTGVVGTGSVLGVKDVKIQKKTWYGGWKTVAVSEGREAYDRGTMGISLLYENAEKGATYRISCIHYGDVNGYTEYENVTGDIVFTY